MGDARTVIALTKHHTIFFGSPTALVENQPSVIIGLVGTDTADAILAALAEAGLEIRKSVDLTKHYSWCCLVETECNCGRQGGQRMSSDRQSGWVIERKYSSVTHYFTAHTCSLSYCDQRSAFRSEPETAVRFARREDAEAFLETYLNANGSVAEHVWMEAANEQ